MPKIIFLNKVFLKILQPKGSENDNKNWRYLSYQNISYISSP